MIKYGFWDYVAALIMISGFLLTPIAALYVVMRFINLVIK